MTLTTEMPNISELRDRIHELRKEIEIVTLAFRIAKEKRRSEEVTQLLRKRSELTRDLFQTQSDLLYLYRSKVPMPPVEEWSTAAHA